MTKLSAVLGGLLLAGALAGCETTGAQSGSATSSMPAMQSAVFATR